MSKNQRREVRTAKYFLSLMSVLDTSALTDIRDKGTRIPKFIRFHEKMYSRIS